MHTKKTPATRIAQLERLCARQKESLANLRKLIRMNSIINTASRDQEKLLKTIMRTARSVMQAEASSLMMIDETAGDLVYAVALGEKGKTVKEKFRIKIGQGISGWVAQHGKPLVVPDVTKDPRFYSRVDKETGFVTRSIICVPLKTRNKTIGVLQAINPSNKTAFSQRDLSIFREFATISAVAIENALVHSYEIEEERLRNQLDIARKIQQNLFPSVMPAINGIQCYAVNHAARSVSGDLYDFLVFPDNRIGVLIGDVSGKGIPASLFMVSMVTNLRFFAQAYNDPAEIFNRVNKVLVDESTFGMFITAALLIFDPDKKAVHYVNAGHIPPIRLNKQRGTCTELDRALSPPLGIIKGIKYEKRELPLTHGDTYLLYTDGITEARNAREYEFGTRRLLATVKNGSANPKELVNYVFNQVKSFSSDADKRDDVTLVSAGYC